jgi:hypothetical protein
MHLHYEALVITICFLNHHGYVQYGCDRHFQTSFFFFFFI